jgi:hypothetical protein
MYLGDACLFNKKPGDMRGVGALGGRARARNLRLREAGQVPVIYEPSRPPEETAAEAIRRIDALCPWLVCVECRHARRQAGAGGA